MSRKDLLALAGRTFGLYLTLWTLIEVSILPESIQEFLYHSSHDPASAVNPIHADYLRHYYLIRLAFLVTRIVGLALMARWMHRGGPEVEDLLLPTESDGEAYN